MTCRGSPLQSKMIYNNIQIGVSFKSLGNIDLPRVLYELEQAGISFIHLDFFDGKMVKSQGVSDSEAYLIRRCTKLPLEAHLMEYRPRDMGLYRDLGINRVLIHHESNCDKERTLSEAKDKGMEAGIALKPSTPHDIKEILYTGMVDLVLVMATKSGSCGKVYDESAPDRVRQITELYPGPIEVNSGVCTSPNKPIEDSTTYRLSQAGATRFALEDGLLNIGVSIAEAVKLNFAAASLPFEEPHAKYAGILR